MQPPPREEISWMPGGATKSCGWVADFGFETQWRLAKGAGALEQAVMRF